MKGQMLQEMHAPAVGLIGTTTDHVETLSPIMSRLQPRLDRCSLRSPGKMILSNAKSDRHLMEIMEHIQYVNKDDEKPRCTYY